MTAPVLYVELSLVEGPVSGMLAIAFCGKIIWRAGERTGIHRCVRCLETVDRDTYLRNDHACDDCATNPYYPNATVLTADILANSFRPLDWPEVRAEIERRGKA